MGWRRGGGPGGPRADWGRRGSAAQKGVGGARYWSAAIVGVGGARYWSAAICRQREPVAQPRCAHIIPPAWRTDGAHERARLRSASSSASISIASGVRRRSTTSSKRGLASAPAGCSLGAASIPRLSAARSSSTPLRPSSATNRDSRPSGVARIPTDSAWGPGEGGGGRKQGFWAGPEIHVLRRGGAC
jgi:hypothetical protein